MKKILLTVFLLHITSVFSQNKAIKERIDELKESIEGLEQMEAFYTTRLVVAPGDSAFDENDPFAFTKSEKINSIDFITEKLKTKQFRQDITAPYSYLELNDLNLFDWIELFGVGNFFFDEHPDLMPVLELEKVDFADGTSATAKEIEVADLSEVLGEETSRLNDAFFLVRTTKTITAITYKVNLKNIDPQTAVLNEKQTTATIDNQMITLKEWKGKEVAFLLPEPLYSSVLGYDAVYKDGRFLQEKGSNMTNLPSEEKREQLKKITYFYKETLKKADDKKFKTVSDLDAYIKQNHPVVDTLTPNSVYKTLYFSGPLAELRLYFPSTGAKTITKEIKNSMITYSGQPKKWKVGTDFKTGKCGVLDSKGKWVVPPDYYRIYNQNDCFFDVYENEEGEPVTYWLSENGLQWKYLKKIELYRQDKYGAFLIVEDGVNGPKGVFNTETGEMVVPALHDNIYIEEPFLVIRNDRAFRIVNRQMKLVVEGNYDEVNIDENFIYLLPEGANGFTGYKLMNEKGENISGDYLFERNKAGGNGLVLAFKKGQKEYERHFFYLNEKGKAVISLNPAKYKEAEPFRHNRALVKNTDDYYGFINEKGTEVIQCNLIQANIFRGKYALVRKKNEKGNVWTGLIDENGKQRKEFKEWPYYIHFDEKENSWVYQFDDGSRYNEEGMELKKIE